MKNITNNIEKAISAFFGMKQEVFPPVFIDPDALFELSPSTPGPELMLAIYQAMMDETGERRRLFSIETDNGEFSMKIQSKGEGANEAHYIKLVKRPHLLDNQFARKQEEEKAVKDINMRVSAKEKDAWMKAVKSSPHKNLSQWIKATLNAAVESAAH